jgi:Amidohydrolase
MGIRHLPIVGSPTIAPIRLRKIAIEEHFVDPEQVQPHFGDSFSEEFAPEGSSYGGFNPEFAAVVFKRLRDLREGRIEEMDAAGIDVAVLSHTVFWAALEELGVPLYLHPRLPARAVQGAMYRGHPELVGVAWGFAPETATHVLRLVYGGVFDRHPDARLIIGHLGETLPFFAGRIQRAFEYNPYSRRTKKRLQDYLSDNIWVTTSGNFNDQALITAVLTVGADHIMFASDYPYDMATDAARWIEAAPISENDRRKICYDNAAALFGLSS